MSLTELLNKKMEPNPFSKKYYEKQKNEFAQKVREMKIGTCEMKLMDIHTKLKGAMYIDSVDAKNVPVFKIGGKTWMSLTPMEVETHAIPINLSWGRVGVGGLGAGYFTQAILEKKNVDEVVVYEINQEVIDHYYAQFGEHEKLTIKKEDALTIRNEEFQFFYMDIYPEGKDEEAIHHMKKLIYNNNIEEYHFWTQEAVYAELLLAGHIVEIPLDWKMKYHPFVLALLEEKKDKLDLQSDGDDWLEILEEANWCEV